MGFDYGMIVSEFLVYRNTAGRGDVTAAMDVNGNMKYAARPGGTFAKKWFNTRTEAIQFIRDYQK